MEVTGRKREGKEGEDYILQHFFSPPLTVSKLIFE